MSNEISKFSDPGLPEHIHRKSDSDPKAEKRAEQQVAILFLISALGTVLTIASYIFIKQGTFVYLPILGDVEASQLFLGLGLTISLIFIGFGAVQWARRLMPDTEVIAERHEFRSEEIDRKEFVETIKERAATAGLGRRSLIKRSLGLALGVIGLTPLVMLRDLGPLPKKALNETSWKSGTRLVTDPGNRPIHPEDLEVGSVAQVALYEQQTKHLLCPCHQSTFDVTRAAKVIFGPAARPLPQLAISVDSQGYLVATQGFTEPIGPSFWERSS